MLIVCRVLQGYTIVLFGRIILSWFPISPNSGLSGIYRFLFVLTEPVLAPIRRIIPPIGMGGMGLDLSPLIVFFAIALLQARIC